MKWQKICWCKYIFSFFAIYYLVTTLSLKLAVNDFGVRHEH
jgi:hypothetical protein